MVKKNGSNLIIFSHARMQFRICLTNRFVFFFYTVDEEKRMGACVVIGHNTFKHAVYYMNGSRSMRERQGRETLNCRLFYNSD